MSALPVGTLQTPALLLERDRFERNLARMNAHMARWPKVQLRPHLKTAKSIEVARHVCPTPGPITVSTIREAETFVAHGFSDVIYAVGIAPDKLARVAKLNRGGVQVAIILDNIAAAHSVAEFARSENAVLQTLIEIDTDNHRGGLQPGDPLIVEIGGVLANAGALRGVLTHAGGSYSARSDAELTAFAEQERAGITKAAEQLRAAGLPCPVVSVGSTPTALFTEDLTGVTEVRAGVYMFMDLVMVGLNVCSVEDIAISVLTSVIGHQTERGQVIVDAGWTALSRDRGTQSQPIDRGFGLVCDVNGRALKHGENEVIVAATNQEHGILANRDGSPVDVRLFPIGSKLRVLPNHACATAGQHSSYHVVASGKVLEEWTRFGQW